MKYYFYPLLMLCQHSVFAQFVGIKSISSNKESQNYDKSFTKKQGIGDDKFPPPFPFISSRQFRFTAGQKIVPSDIFVEMLIVVDKKLYEKV